MFLSPKLRLLALMGPLGPLRAPFKGHLNSSKYFFFKRNIVSLHSFVTLSQNTKRLCLYAHTYVFWLLGPFLKIKGPLKGPSKGIFFKSLKVPHNGVIKTLCAKNQVCKSIGVTCSTYRRFTKDKEENTRKWPKKGPQRAKNQNFEKQKMIFFLVSQGVLCQKIRFLGQKL